MVNKCYCLFWGCFRSIPFRTLVVVCVVASLFIFPFSLDSMCQTLENRYRSHLTSDGITYFFCPKKIGKTQVIDKFNFDMTYNTTNDTVTINFTIISHMPVTVYSIALQNGDGMLYKGNGLLTFYRDVRDRKYETRTTSKFSLDRIRNVFSKTAPLSFYVYLSEGIVGTASYSKSQWKRERRQITQIMDLINYKQ